MAPDFMPPAFIAPDRIAPAHIAQAFIAQNTQSQEFEKTNLPWEMRLWQQRTGEWWENLTSGWKVPELPENTPKPDVAPQTWEGLFWLILIAIGGLITWKLYPVIARLIAEQSIARSTILEPAPEPVLKPDEWLQQARGAQAKGDYAQAARALYFAALTRLQDREILSTDRSLTNGEYRIQLQKKLRNTQSDRAYQTLSNTHEAIYYSNHETISAERYEACDRAYREIDQETP